MAKLLWGKVYYKNQFAGILREEPGMRYTFTYDPSYLEANHPAIAYTLPLQSTPFISEQYLPSFFDNLVAEGWLEQVQCRLLGKRTASRFELLLGFGADCAGAVSIIDPELAPLHLDKIDASVSTNIAVFKNRASLSGVQPKILLRKNKNHFELAQNGQLSTHIGKLASESHADITYNEWLTLQACQSLIPNDDFVETKLITLPDIDEKILLIKRFDRTDTGEKIHFEEFNQLLNLQTHEKYDGDYKDMANFIKKEKRCLPSDVYRLYKRILVGLLTGNTDMHFKNFAMMHQKNGLQLTPNYDQVAAAVYKPYQYIALTLDNVADRIISQLKPKHIVALGHEFGLSNAVIEMAINEIQLNIEKTSDLIHEAEDGHTFLKNKIITFMEKRWKGSFGSIGKLLSKKP